MNADVRPAAAAADFLKNGFEVIPARNGGWIITNRFSLNCRHDERMMEAAFSSEADMLAYLFEHFTGEKK